MFPGDARTAIEDFLSRYGEKALVVLRIAYNIARDPNIDHRLGDFSYKHIVFKLYEAGVTYNPVNLLKVMEKNYGIIEKSYTSKNQTWWRFRDIDSVRDAIEAYTGSRGEEDPRLKLLAIKYRSMEPLKMLNTLHKLAVKDKLSEVDKEVFRGLVFNELEKVTSILQEMMRYEEAFSNEIRVLNEILGLAEAVARKLEKSRQGSTSSLRSLQAEGVPWGNDNS
ncbi:hypothetical protein [Desulfurococcus mucosus]|uniref:Uncharacterized protein n=1 Tax=Desulfurococcus mucosus (strain ATCC 35584 / DSM 2162 / JCM 9187 / O7/1) TaxID=765177 RepID=E8R980_DESM0|nr:hypothetical protein [Desulfurococcus mucosus]ADV65056.1 hypothetical protein Desmu_0751 [Desulfurococcus mucosus DSM 2162]